MGFKNFLFLYLLSLTLTACDGFKISGQNSRPPAAPLGYDESASTLSVSGATIKQVVLDNGLKVILISSPTSKTASAAVGARVGHKDNPREFQGLAHYLEHMLFLGTKEFPVVGEYGQFLKSNGGMSNAYTSTDHTNYYLQIKADKFEEALNRLSRFFVNPLFDESYIEREKNAVHNEFNLRFQPFKQGRPISAFLEADDTSRLFAVGNNVTLKEATAEDTRKMFEEYYFAQAMHAVIAGPQDLATLEQWALKYFSDIKGKKDVELKHSKPLMKLNMADLPAQVNFKSDGEERFIRLFVPVKDVKLENEKLLSAISLLFGDESEDSLMHALQVQGWVRPGANMLSGGASHEGISAMIQLTEKGYVEYKHVINYVKGYISFLQSSRMPSYINKELSSLEAISALSQEFFEINADVIQGINRLYFAQDWRPENWHQLFLGRVYDETSNREYQDFLSRLLFDKIFIQLAHPSFTDVAVDFEAHKNLEQGGLGLIEQNGQKTLIDYLYNYAAPVVAFDVSEVKTEGVFSMKKENVYLPDDFDIYQSESIDLYNKKTGEWGELRYNATPDVQSPKAYLNLKLYSSGIDLTNPKDSASMFLFREWMRNKAASSSYAMNVAGFELSYPVYVDKGIIAIDINGWSDTFLPVLEDTFSTIRFSVTDSEFQNLKMFYKEKIQLEQAGDIGAMASRSTLSMVTPVYLDYGDLYQALDGLTSVEFKQFVTRYFSAFHVQGALTGNVQSHYVDRIVKLLEENFKPTWNTQVKPIKTYLDAVNDQGQSVLLEKDLEGTDKQNSVYLGYWNLGVAKDSKDKWLARIFGTWIYPDYYEELRTNKQLAYSLYAFHTEMMKHDFLLVQLQSSTHVPDDIEKEVDGFVLNWAGTELAKKSDDLLKATVDNVVVSYDLPKAPQALHALLLQFIDDGYATLADVEQDLEVLKSVTVNDVVEFGKKNFVQTPKRGAFSKIKKQN